MYSKGSPPIKKMGGSTLLKALNTAGTGTNGNSNNNNNNSSVNNAIVGRNTSTNSCPSHSAVSSSTLLYTPSSTTPSAVSNSSLLSNSSIHHYNNNNHHHHHHIHNNYGSNSSISSSTSSTTYLRHKRGKKGSWGARERAGMSFLIVIAFFAVFGLIILTELFMIDDKNHNGIVVLRHGNLGNRLGDSMPDYDNVKEDYDLADGNLFLTDNKLGIFQFQSDNKFKMHDAMNAAGVVGDNGVAGNDGGINRGGTGAVGSIYRNNNNNNNNIGGASGNSPIIPWGQMLPTKIEQTLPHYPIGIQPIDGNWQIVNGTRFKFFVFSAYYDRRDGKMIRIIGATKTRGPERVWCRFWYPYKNSNNRTKYFSATVMARVKIIRENWNLKYSACFVLCPLRAPGLDVPYSVSVVSRLRTPPGNILLVRNTDQDTDFINRTTGGSSFISSSSSSITNNIPNKMAICVKPFHFNYNQALYMLEFIELNSLLGISHFTFYNHTLGPRTSCILKHYIDGNVPANLTAIDEIVLVQTPKSGVNNNNNNNNNNDNNNNGNIEKNGTSSSSSSTIRKSVKYETIYTKPTVEILPWNLRMRSQKEIRTEGLFAALNDCLYRNMYRYSHIALIDLDEFIIPRHNDTLIELISWINQRYSSRNTGAYSFQNAFFYLQFPDDPLIYDSFSNNPALRSSLITQRKTRRRAKLHPQKQRSKYICRPEAVIEAGNHFVWEFVPGKGSLNVPAEAGILHHYRVCEFGGDDCIKSPSIVDRTALKYNKRLLERVENVYNYLKKPCNLLDLPSAPTKPTPTRKKSFGKLQNQKIEITNNNHLDNKLNLTDGTSKIKVKIVA